MKIDNREISPNFPPYIVAEISCNHTGSIDRAYDLIERAKHAQADAVKFQCYTADAMTIDCKRPDFEIKDGPWRGRSFYSLYKKNETPPEWFPRLFAHARKHKITAFASVFDRAGVDLLEKLDCPAYKIASFEIVDLPLIKYAAATGKPIIISTGMATFMEMQDALDAAPGATFLHCVSEYPTPIGHANLGRLAGFTIPRFGVSDHSISPEVPIAATALGACMIEKHLRGKGYYGADAGFSLTPMEFGKMVTQVRNTWAAMQSPVGDPEAASRQFRRSLYVVEDVKAGEPFTETNVRSIRPGFGLPPRELERVLAGKAARDIARGTPLTVDMIG